MNRINLPKNKGNDLLFHAIAHLNAKDIILLLDDKEADINARNINGATPLHYAVQVNSLQIVDLLLKYKANPNLQEYIEVGLRTPLHYAVEKNSIEVV